jgi:hypothetical protein
MTLDEFRREMWAYREAADKDASALKESNLAWQWLRDLYRKFDAEERKLADQVLEEWVLSDDENVRYDALVLIGDFKIFRATLALRKLSARLRHSKAPGAPYEMQKVDRILNDLGGETHAGRARD